MEWQRILPLELAAIHESSVCRAVADGDVVDSGASVESCPWDGSRWSSEREREREREREGEMKDSENERQIFVIIYILYILGFV